MSEKATDVQGALAAKRAYWGQGISEWERSGQAQKVFCAERSLVLSTFQWWCAQRKRRAMAKPVTPFLPMALQAVAQLTARVK